MNNCCIVQRNALVAREEGRDGSAIFSERRDSIVCPKPRRVGILSNSPNVPLRWHGSNQAEACDSGAGMELLDLILKKEGYGAEQTESHIASSPPFFSGSPPTRAGNPLTQDARFGVERVSPLSTPSASSLSGVPSSKPSSAHRSGCSVMSFGHKPAAVRIEGFDCMNRDRRNSSIPAFA